MMFTIWKVRFAAGESPDYFSYSIKRDEFYPVILTASQFQMLFPDLNPDDVPEAPDTMQIMLHVVFE